MNNTHEALKPFAKWCEHVEAAFKLPVDDNDFPAVHSVSGSPTMADLRRARDVYNARASIPVGK